MSLAALKTSLYRPIMVMREAPYRAEFAELNSLGSFCYVTIRRVTSELEEFLDLRIFDIRLRHFILGRSCNNNMLPCRWGVWRTSIV
jgi:hypothetical protein